MREKRSKPMLKLPYLHHAPPGDLLELAEHVAILAL